MEHEDLVKALQAALHEVAGDTSVSRDKVYESLEDIRCELEEIIAAMEAGEPEVESG